MAWEPTPIFEKRQSLSPPVPRDIVIPTSPVVMKAAASVVSEVSETKTTGKERMEAVYGPRPTSLLSDIGDDAPWPF